LDFKPGQLAIFLDLEAGKLCVVLILAEQKRKLNLLDNSSGPGYGSGCGFNIELCRLTDDGKGYGDGECNGDCTLDGSGSSDCCLDNLGSGLGFGSSMNSTKFIVAFSNGIVKEAESNYLTIA